MFKIDIANTLPAQSAAYTPIGSPLRSRLNSNSQMKE